MFNFQDIWKEVQNERYIYYMKLFSEIFFVIFRLCSNPNPNLIYHTSFEIEPY